MDEKFFKRIQWVAALICRRYRIEHLVDDVSGRAFLAISKNPNKKCTVDQLVLDAIRAECGSATRKGHKKTRGRDVFKNPGNSPQSFRDARRELRYASTIDETIDREKIYSRIKEKLTRIQKRVFEEVYSQQKSAVKAAKAVGLTEGGVYYNLKKIEKIGRELYEDELRRIGRKTDRIKPFRPCS